MGLITVLLKLANCIVNNILTNSFQKAENKLQNQHNHHFTLTKCSVPKEHTIICDIQNTLLLNSKSFFPYFMLIAFEGGSILRACFLLSAYPLILLLNHDHYRLKFMIFITFCGMKVKNMENIGRTVLTKLYLENLDFQVYELVFRTIKEVGTTKVVVLTSVPRVMVDEFCREFLGVDNVVATELHSVRGYYSGFVATSGVIMKQKVVKEWFGDEIQQDIGAGYCVLAQYKEATYVMSNGDMGMSSRRQMPRDEYPKPLVFHDGRLAFLPTPFVTLAMFLWFPFGIFIAMIRLFVGVFFPYKVTLFVCALTGLKIRIKGGNHSMAYKTKEVSGGGVLFVCTHRTLLDPVFLSLTTGKPLIAVTYSVSKMSEILSPIRTTRLTRDREKDGEMMQKLLKDGDLVICPEGTTCREPYLLRFSSLFAELTDEIVPVAINTHVTMFYGTTASGFKWLDPIYFLMNPRPTYHVQLLGKLDKGLTCGFGNKSSHEVANHIQKLLGDALGFECTNLTRKDKYSMLVGNKEIIV
uniref:glycerol-3-phosphate acyltransferase 1-like n=1 Tax=Erigeron canadensis TaxID=72917 RepID=UPI001CB9B4D6|nr:glycerol-3-phosphate acyltransferase 1-like [Erigeron canadensis]